MNLTQHTPDSFLHRFALFILLSLLATTALAKPRPVAPPWPETGLLLSEGFDQAFNLPADQVADVSIWTESWSGYALNRSLPVVQPFAVPMIGPGTNRALNLDPESGAIRFWYQPNWSGAWTGLGSGPGDLARLLTLVSTNGTSCAVWWSLVVSPDGGELHLVCEQETGPTSCLSASINWEEGSWHCVALGYTPTNTVLIVDGRIVAEGGGLIGVPAQLLAQTLLLVGSDVDGLGAAQGHFEELSTFTGRSRFRARGGYPFGMGTAWDVEYYYSGLSPQAALGPVTPEEEAARRAQAAARRAEQLAMQEVTIFSMEELDDYDPALGFRLLGPQVAGTNLILTISNGNTNAIYNILHVPAMATIPVWSIVATGAVGQFSFTIPRSGAEGWFRGVEGADWDGDGIPNWMDADPLAAGVGALMITIDVPTNESPLY